MSRARERLEQLLITHGDHIPLGEAAACMAADDDPTVTVDQALQKLGALGQGLHLMPDEPLETRVARVVNHLFTHHGFHGDSETYDDPANSLIHLVIERRAGLPILLSIIMIEVAAKGGLELHPVGFPGHFLVSPAESDPQFFLDPFHGGRVIRLDTLQGRLDQMGVPRHLRAGCLARSSGRSVLIRMCTNLRRAYEQLGQHQDVARLETRIAMLQELGR